MGIYECSARWLGHLSDAEPVEELSAAFLFGGHDDPEVVPEESDEFRFF